MNQSMYGPLEIPGLTFVRELGTGGFAEVYLYEQAMPHRQVAVKIMRQVVTDPRAQAQFEGEANLMAAVSTHPSIVTIHDAQVSASGRPYLVMEFCSRPGLAQRYRQRVLSVPEMLETMIRLCGAVETAHRAGILHRDIKPANVLTTDYGWPALTDFGISAVVGEATFSGGGLSLPWSAPEVVLGGKADARSDVYSLAATAYTVLAGASPFDTADGAEMSAFVGRILSMEPPRIQRNDIPEPLQRSLALALAKNPDERPQSASEFARSLQRIEQELQLPLTHMDVPNRPGRAADDDIDDDSESTRLGGSAARARVDATSASRPPVIALPEPADDDLDERTSIASANRAPAPVAPAPIPVAAPPVVDEPQSVDEETVVSSRSPAPAAELDERTRIASSANDDDLDDRTQLSARSAPELADERTRIATEPDDGRTRISRPGTGTDDDADERTQLSGRSNADPTRVLPDDRTRVSPERSPDRTVVTGGKKSSGPAVTSFRDVPAPATRHAVVPGVDSGLQDLYRIRSAELQQAPLRAAPTPQASAARYDDGSVVARAQQQSAKRAKRRLLWMLLGLAVLVVIVVAGVVLLLTVGGS